MGNFADHKTENQKFEDVIRNMYTIMGIFYLKVVTFPKTADEIKNWLLMNLSKKTNLILL